ncbi:AMP-binding protein [Propionicicella superfundia]|uniref:AMP-binding protein n=1 Tax=Propionicicella superfundia TaxID=348582 RepID=UPI00042087A4|nr:AMP-binding protein [Propionicicella superfundia]
MSKATEAIREARDLLLAHRGEAAVAAADFRWPDISGPFNWAIDWFDAIGRGRDTLALWIRETDGTDSTYTYGELVDRSDAAAEWLRGVGVGIGDVVMLMLGNQVELWVAQLAVMKIGAVILPTTEALPPADIADRIARANVRAVIANPRDADKFASVAGDFIRITTGHEPAGWRSFTEAREVAPVPQAIATDASDPVLAYFTSGTTKDPKLVFHTQLSYPVGHLTTMYFIGVRPGDVHLNISSPGWGKHAWSSFFSPWLAEATVFVYNYRRFDAADLIAQLENAHIACFCAPPTVWRMMLLANLGSRPAGLREIVGAGEPLNPEVIKRVQDAWGLTIRDGYGQTETTCIVGNAPGEIVKPGSMGRRMPGTDLVVIDPDTKRPDAHGEVCLPVDPWPFNLMSGYADAAQVRQAIHGGYYHTGDLVSQDEDGYLTYVGRTDDVFKASDYKVSPFELESVLLEHPAVAEAAVVPAADPVRLAVPKAYVHLAPGWEPSRDTALTILRYAKENLAPYLRVRRLEFAELPKTISGKIRRVALRFQEGRDEFRYEDFTELATRR